MELVGFAKFLEKGKLYKFAAEEYERLYFTYPKEKQFFNGLMRNYRASGQLDLLTNRFKSAENISPESVKYFTLGLLDYQSYDEAQALLNTNNNLLEEDFSLRMNTDIELLKGNYNLAEKRYATYSFEEPDYLNLIQEGKNLKRKSPLLAGILSALIPGTGRFYTGDYKDGIISLLFISTTAYQAYRRFDKNGSKSVSGWIYGGISLGFHLGNIYGSVQSAKYYNSQKQKAHNVKVKNYIDMYYSKF
jgi:TM2 domain-containing membrane protein YozV